MPSAKWQEPGRSISDKSGSGRSAEAPNPTPVMGAQGREAGWT